MTSKSISHHADLLRSQFTTAGEAQPAAAIPKKAETYARAERRMRRGRILVVSGFVVAVLGIVAYCIACLGAAVDGEVGTALLESPGRLIGPTLLVIGLGTLLWLVGSFLFLSGAMDSDPDGPDILL